MKSVSTAISSSTLFKTIILKTCLPKFAQKIKPSEHSLTSMDFKIKLVLERGGNKANVLGAIITNS